MIFQTVVRCYHPPWTMRICGFVWCTVLLSVLAFFQLGTGDRLLWGHRTYDLIHGKTSSHSTKVAKATIPANTTVILCDLSGELGNCMAHYAHCSAISLSLERIHNVPTTVVVRHDTTPSAKWKLARQDLAHCFPHFRSLDFSGGNGYVWEKRLRTMRSHLKAFKGINSRDPNLVNQTLFSFVNYTSHHRPVPRPTAVGTKASEQIITSLLRSNFMAGLDFYVDRFLDDYRQIFAFDFQRCCRALPDPDESVFHLRNFVVELSKERGTQLGLTELGPEQTAYELLGHLNVGDKVAIVSRFTNEHVQRYVDALERRGLRVRVVEHQTGVQDFCFLLQTQKELVGIAISTYFKWAAILSNSSRVVAYSLDNKEMLARRGRVFFHYNFTHPDLRSKFHFRLLRPDPEEIPVPASEQVLEIEMEPNATTVLG